MLDPNELTTGVEITDVRREELFGRPVVAISLTMHAVAGTLS